MDLSWSRYVAALLRLRSLNRCSPNQILVYIKCQWECPQAREFIIFIGRMSRASWAAVDCIRAQARAPISITPSSPRTIMSTALTAPSTSTSQSNFASIFNASLELYKRKTKKDLASHPLLPSLQYCESPEAILTVLRDQVPAFNQSQNSDDRLTKWVAPTVNVLYSFSETIGQGVGLVNIMTFRRGEFLA
jgi:hypothetical protein